MTSSRTKTSVDTLRKAGSFLGLDLRSLFRDDEEGGESPFAELQPSFKATSTIKGRGSVMGFKKAVEPTSVRSFQLAPAAPAAAAPAAAAPAAAAPAAAAPTPATPVEPTYTYTDPGDKGYFGMKDYEELMRQNAPMSLIKEYAEKSPYGVGPDAAKSLGMRPYTETQGRSTQFPITSARTIQYTDPGDTGYFGMKDYEELQRQGASMNLIKEYASKSPMGVGPEAARLLGMQATTKMPSAPAAEPASSATSFLNNWMASPSSTPKQPYTFTDPGDKGAFGMQDYNELAGQGVDEDEIRRVARGFSVVGPEAKRRLGI
jgi:hypothetical protein